MRVNIEKIFYQFFGGDVPQLEVHVDIGSDRDKPPPADKDEARDVHGRGQNDGHNFDKARHARPDCLREAKEPSVSKLKYYCSFYTRLPEE